MVEINKNECTILLKKVVSLLVNKKYNQLFEEDFKQEGEYANLWKNIENYGGVMTMPSEEAFESPKFLDIYKKSNDACLDFDLWIDGNESDLTLSLYIKSENGKYYYEIEDIHVM